MICLTILLILPVRLYDQNKDVKLHIKLINNFDRIYLKSRRGN